MTRSRRSRTAGPRPGRGFALAGAALLGAATVASMAGPTVVAGAASATPSTPTVVLTVPTATNHGYRHGAVPRKTRDVAGVEALGFAPTAPGAQATAARASKRKLLHYGGGLTAGALTAAGVTTGQPEVYLVFMGSQWGTESVDSSGDHVFSHDTDAMAPALQRLFHGLGTGSETWSGTLTQYCDGAPVGATVCTQGDLQVPYPSVGVLAGVWYDGSSSATSEEAAGLTGHQLAAEAEAAATHFGDTGQPANRDTQYVIVSPTGTDPDGWADPKTGYCAYHDDTHDPTITGGGPVAGPIVAFTNLPYVPDAGASCGAGTVNSPGILDGATEAASHEYAETLTDQFPEGSPPGGWSSTSGEEDADLCAYVSTGPGAMFDLALTTGTVTVQGLWSNQTDNCADGESNFVYVPSVTSFSPGGATAGSPVTISGTNLGGATAVTFAGIPATITGDTTISVTATVPTGALSGHITVATPGGTSTSAGAFEVAPSITSISPTTVGPGGTLSIDGSGLGSARQVLVGGKRARMSSDTATQIVVTVPPKAVTGSVTVSTKGGTASLGGLTIS